MGARGTVAVFGPDGMFLGTGEVDADAVLRPKRLLALQEKGGPNLGSISK